MADRINLETRQHEALTCDVCEAMCLDAVDGTLTPAEHAAFELHVASCTACTEQFAEAQRGAAWMDMLKAHRPEPSSSLLDSILAKTSGAQSQAFTNAPAPALLPMPMLPLPAIVAAPAVAGGRLLQFRQRVKPSTGLGGNQFYLQPRLAMTAAMAFFSIALTMNLTGTRLSDLRPSALHRTVADAGAGAARSFQNLRVVYQVESKVSELRQDELHDDREAPAAHPREQPSNEVPAPARPQKDSDRQQTKPNGSSQLTLPSQPLLHVTDDTALTLHTESQTQPALTRQKGA